MVMKNLWYFERWIDELRSLVPIMFEELPNMATD